METKFLADFEDLQRLNGGPARYRVALVTPADAAHFLQKRRPGAKKNLVAIRNYATAMRERQWILNGMPVIFSHQGVLLDGYQRLLACVEAQMPFESFLLENVADDASHTIDQQRRRSFATVLEARGVVHAHAMQACLVKLIRYDEHMLGRAAGQLPSWGLLDRTLRANPQLVTALEASFARPRCPLPEAVRSPLICMGYAVDTALTDRLLDALTHPERYAVTEPGVVLWHEIKRGWARKSPRRTTAHLLALAIRALDATFTHTAPRRLSWVEHGTQTVTAEAYPRLAGYAGLTKPGPGETFDDSRTLKSAFSAAGGSVAHRRDISFAVEEIGPDLALQYLSHNSGNRRISGPHIAALSRDLAQNRWMFNAQPICFAANGRLLNGQHRLHAVILAGHAIEAVVVRGLEAAAYATYDNHAKRRVELTGKGESFGDQALAAAMANLLWHHERKTRAMHSAKATAAEVQQIIAEHPRLLALRSFARRMGNFGRASVIGYAAYVMERDDPVLAARFLASLETGADQRPGHPILALRGSLQKLRSDKAPQSEQLATLLAGWERFKARQHGS